MRTQTTLLFSRSRAAVAPGLLALACAAGSLASARADQLSGFTEPWETVAVASAESGVVAEVAVQEGQQVQRGDVLCSLESKQLQAALAVARAKAAAQGRRKAAAALVALRKKRFDAIDHLYRQENASQDEQRRARFDLDGALAEQLAAEEETQAAELEVQRILIQIERRTVRSPCDGYVLRVLHRPGEAVVSSEPQVAQIVALQRLRVRYHLPTQRARQLRTGQQVALFFPETQQSASAVIELISPVTDAKSGTVRVDLAIDNAQGKWPCGVPCQWHADAAAAADRDPVSPIAAPPEISQRPRSTSRFDRGRDRVQ